MANRGLGAPDSLHRGQVTRLPFGDPLQSDVQWSILPLKDLWERIRNELPVYCRAPWICWR
jgi:hypothetical protein